MPRPHPFAAQLAAVLALAFAAPAFAGTTADSMPGVDGAAMVQAARAMGPSPDAHLDVSHVRCIHPRKHGGPRGRATASVAAGAALPAGKSVDMKVLLLSADGTEPSFHWWKTALTNDGVPFDAIVASTADPITAASLRAGVDHGRYQAVVLATGGLAYSTDGGFTFASALSSDEWSVLQAYEEEFAVREVDAYAYPQAAYGLTPVGGGRDMSGVEAHITDAGTSVFSDLIGPVDVDRWSWGYEGAPVAGSSWQTLVADDQGAVVGTYTRDDGTEALVNTIDTNEWSIHGHELFHGMLEWVTRGVHLGMSRNWFRLDVDDLFLPDDRWSMDSHATPEDDSSTVRMVPSDVDRAVAWEQSTGVKLNFLFNGDGYSAGDPLSQALLTYKGDFTWENHTFSHPDLDPASLSTIEDEVQRNIDFGQAHGLNFDPTELVTGGHSGLANPDMPQALDDIGIKFFGADDSRQHDQYALGNALSVPRHPTGVYYNVGTRAEELDEYNFINFTACPAGNLGCLTAPADWSTYVDNEASMILRHILDNDPRPHYVHQSNLAEDGTMYPVFDEVLARYRKLFKPDLVQPSLTQSGRELQRMAAWRSALANGQASGTITSSGQVVVSTTVPVAVPVTGGTVGSTYGGETSGWTDAPAGDTTVGGDTTGPVPDPPGQTTPDDPAGTTDPGSQAPGSQAPDPSAPQGGDASLIAHWSFDSSDGASSLPDGAGGHTGYWRNGPPAFDGGGAVDFPGGPLYVEVNGITAPTTAYTLDASVRFDSTDDMTIVEHGGGGALGIVDGHITFRNVNDDIADPADAPTGWHRVTGTWDGSTQRLYVDGTLVASGTSSARPSGISTLYIGRGAMAGFMDGVIDDVAYYSGAIVPSPAAADTSAETRAVDAADTSPQSDAPDSPGQDAAPASSAVAAHVVTAASSKKKTPRRRHPVKHHRRARSHAKTRHHR